MHAHLYIGTTTDKRVQFIHETLNAARIPVHHRIVIEPDETVTIGISQVRRFIHQLQLIPMNKHGTVAAIIPDAQALTIQAQQALLKTIEEPPKHIRIDIGALSVQSVLPTIVSRCRVVQLAPVAVHEPSASFEHALNSIASLCEAGPGKRLDDIANLGTTKEEYLVWIDTVLKGLTHALRQQAATDILIGTTTVPASHIAHALLHARRIAKNNIHPRLSLEHIFLRLSARQVSEAYVQ